MNKRNKVITTIVVVALFLSIGTLLIYRHVQESARVASMERMNQGIERILAVIESEGIHAIKDIASMIDEDVSLNEAEKTRLKQRFFWATFRLRSNGDVFYTEEGPTLNSSVFITLIAIEQRLEIPPAQTFRYLLSEADGEYSFPQERGQITRFASDEDRGGEGTFLYDLVTFYRYNIEHIRAEFPDNILSQNADMRGLPLPILERLIQMEQEARVGSQ